ncbi:hypothetical protein J2X83_000731 [Brevibacillus nitrificans]|nr:hypothetical protein [Brevibacillus nitrificans]
MVPGFAVSLLAIVIVSNMAGKPSAEVHSQFDMYQQADN